MVKWITKLFDEKVALNVSYHYDGISGGDMWRHKVRDYLIGCYPEIGVMLDWAEEQDCSPITIEGMDHTPWRWQISEDPRIIAGHLWKFLRMLVEKDAEKTFRAATPALNGLEVWRALNWEINAGRSGRQWELGERLRQPHPVGKYSEVSAAISAFDTLLQEYLAAGGARLPESELKQLLLRTFPQDLRETLMLKATEPETYENFKAHVRVKLAFIMRCRAESRGHGQHARVLEAHMPSSYLDAAQQGDDEQEELPEDQNFEDELNALISRFGGRGAGGRFTKRPQPKRGPNASRSSDRSPDKKSKCTMCGGDHSRDKCPKGYVEPSKRPCFNCGKFGHRAANCPDKPARALEQEGRILVCEVCDDDEYQLIPKSKTIASRPMPRRAVLGDFLKTSNRFEAIERKRREEENEPKDTSEKTLNSNVMHDNSVARILAAVTVTGNSHHEQGKHTCDGCGASWFINKYVGRDCYICKNSESYSMNINNNARNKNNATKP